MRRAPSLLRPIVAASLLVAPVACFHDEGTMLTESAGGSTTGGMSATSGSTSSSSSTGSTDASESDGTSTTTDDTTTTGDPTTSTTASTDPNTTAGPTSDPTTTTSTTDPVTTDPVTTDPNSTSTTGPVEDDCPSDPDLVACYEFEDGWPGTLVDGSGNGYNGVMMGVVETTGVSGLAAGLTDESSIKVPQHDALNLGAGMTLSVWVRPDLAPAKDATYILDKAESYSLYHVTDGKVRCRFAGNEVGSDIKLASGQWNHIGCIQGDGVLSIYINGIFDGDVPSDGSTPSGLPLGIGNRGNTLSPDTAYNGAIDRVTLWRRTLTGEELCAFAGC